MGYCQGRFDVGIPSKGYQIRVRRRPLRSGRERLRDVRLGLEAIDDILVGYMAWNHLQKV